MTLGNPLVAVGLVAVMQMIGLAFVFGWYAIRDHYGHDCDHGDHKIMPVGAQNSTSPGAPIFGKRTTVILYRCRWCPHVESIEVDGAWPISTIVAWGLDSPPYGWTPDGADPDETAPVPAVTP